MIKEQESSSAQPDTTEVPVCNDYDEDCAEVECKVSCWLYMMEEGMCPYLREANSALQKP